MIQFIFKYLQKKSEVFISLLGIVLILTIGLIDYFTGAELRLSIFYLIPVALVAYFSKQWIAILFSVFSVLIWYLIDLFFTGPPHYYLFLTYWDALFFMGFFLIFTLLISKLKSNLEYELELARSIQQSFIPNTIPKGKEFDIAYKFIPAKKVSGDYYDIFRLDDHKIGICIADAMGHGIPASLLMSNLQAAVKIYSNNPQMPDELCEKLNQTICNNSAAGNYITFFYCILDTQKRTLTYTNAGNSPPILARKEGSSSFLETGGSVIGFLPDMNYQKDTIQLDSGDKVLLFTDGITEVMNASKEEFGIERLAELARENPNLDVSELQHLIKKELDNFSRSIYNDDITLVIVSVN